MARPFLYSFLLGIVGLALSACSSRCGWPGSTSSFPLYSRVAVSEFDGRCVSEYTAEGPVIEIKGGFCFRAVERRIFEPRPVVYRYPLGRPITVVATNIVVTPAAQPVWLTCLTAKRPDLAY